jgi:hypothetical protein
MPSVGDVTRFLGTNPFPIKTINGETNRNVFPNAAIIE